MGLNFASDNCATVHPRILQILPDINHGHVPSYGYDVWTEKLAALIGEMFGEAATAFPVFNGTGANVIALGALTKRYQGILCSDVAHIQGDECGAPERFLGVKLIDIPSRHGKVSPDCIEPFLATMHGEHQVQPRVLCITQSTERGTTYKLDELRALREFAKKHSIKTYMDGARFANAVASLGVSPREMVEAAGVDIVSLGGTKNGLMLGELIIVLDPALADEMKYFRKQAMQLASKMRYVSAPFCEYIESGLWLTSAHHANAMAQRLADRLAAYGEVQITERVEANVVFATTPRAIVEPLQKKYAFHTWDEQICEHRWMCSFDTTPEVVDEFAAMIGNLLQANKG